MSDDMQEGGCACGAVRYRVEGTPIFVNNCHCTLCQRQSGTGSALNAFFESERVTLLSGELARFSVATGSGGLQEIVRCAACGTALWSHYPRLGRHGTGIKAGTLDKPGAMRPDAVIFARSRLPWVALPDDIPVFEEFYDFRTLLPADRLARLGAIAARAKAAS